MDFKNKIRYRHVLFYLMHSKLHWQERENAISEILNGLAINPSEEDLRILDIGCGPGLLAEMAIEKGFIYLGVDADQDSIDYCREKYQNEARVCFSKETIPSHEITIQMNDIVVLNGVMHHLDDKIAHDLLGHLSQAKLVIIADHYLDKTVGIWPKFLQKRDKGKYVRNYSFFQYIHGYRSVKSMTFPIKIFSLIFWTYFCVAYTPDYNGSKVSL